jgi:hypothetical protein
MELSIEVVCHPEAAMLFAAEGSPQSPVTLNSLRSTAGMLRSAQHDTDLKV